MDAVLLDVLEGAFPLSEAPAIIPGRPHVNTVERWGRKGVSRHGRVVKLESYMVGGIRMTTTTLIEKFLRALNDDSHLCDQLDADETARRAKQAGSALEKLGC